MPVLQATAESLETQIRELRAEVGTDLMGQLSAADKAELKRLVPRLEELKVMVPATEHYVWHVQPLPALNLLHVRPELRCSTALMQVTPVEISYAVRNI